MSTASRVKDYVKNVPEGQPFTASDLATLGPRSAIERTLSRLVDTEEINRVTRGVYMRPESSKYGELPPSTLKVALVKAHGEDVQMHGADALRQFGLSTQHPVSSIYYTTGPTRKFLVAGEPVVLKHISSRKIICPGTNVGAAFTALWYLGKKKTTKKALSQIKQKLTNEEYNELLQNADKMPAWMSDALYRFEGNGRNKL